MSKINNKTTKFVEGKTTGVYNTTRKMPELTGYEHNQIPKTPQDSNRYEGFALCPNEDLKEIQFVEKKYSRTIKNLDKLTKQMLKDDILYGKNTVVTQRMVKPALKGTNYDENDPSNYIYWDSCYKGIQWARLQYICEIWGVKLVEIPPYESGN